MNKTVGITSRTYLRGKPLDEDCKKARTTRFQYGVNDNRTFCYGLYKEMSDWDILEKCKTCGALVDNAKPLISDEEGAGPMKKTCENCVHDEDSNMDWPCINCVNNVRDHFRSKEGE